MTRLATVPLTLVLLALPPLGIIGWASPLISAGILFPGTGWLGLLLTLFLCGMLSSYPLRALAIGLAISVPAQILYQAPCPPAVWEAVSTQFGGVGLDTPDPLAEYRAAQFIQQRALASTAQVVVFPETVVSNWNQATEAFWGPTIHHLKSQGKTILVGANVTDENRSHYFNALIIRGAQAQSDFRQRIPVPVAMWTPFSHEGVPLRLNARGSIKLHGQKAAILICYEQLLIWPAVTSFAERPTLVIGTANGYWASTTRISQIQLACLTSWARLFHLPLLWAENT